MRFSRNACVSHADEDVQAFIQKYLRCRPKTLFIGTVGLERNSLFFPLELAESEIDFRFIVERRRTVSPALAELGTLHQTVLEKALLGRAEFVDVEIIAGDGATVAGRNAIAASRAWLQESTYDEIVVDTTGMSRGTCFPIVRQLLDAYADKPVNIHLLVASSNKRAMAVRGESNDRADWMHGFQGAMGIDRSEDLLKLWVPQLTENAARALSAMYSELRPVAEVCPIVPFPSYDPRRGDNLVAEYADTLRSQWESNVMSLIYAHEADPLDVFRSIVRMHSAREEAFSAAKQSPITILSPAGWRIGSLGMLLAALELELPILYVETIGYTNISEIPAEFEPPCPDHVWHLWLAGRPYAQ